VWSSELLEDNINYFGQQGGFNRIFQTLKGESDFGSCPFNIVSLLLEVIWSVRDHSFLFIVFR
jgi:hypothetical protein